MSISDYMNKIIVKGKKEDVKKYFEHKIYEQGGITKEKIGIHSTDKKQDKIASIIRASNSTAGTEQQRQVLGIIFDYAKASNIWFDSLYDLGDPLSGGGNENTLALNEKDGFIYKANNLSNHKYNILDLFDSIKYHNEIFNCSKCIFVGLTGTKSFIEPIFKQQYIVRSEQATQSDIDNLMVLLDFEKINDHTFKNNEYIVSDLKPRNVLKDEDGNVCVIDDIIKKNTQEESPTERRKRAMIDSLID